MRSFRIYAMCNRCAAVAVGGRDEIDTMQPAMKRRMGR